MFWSIILCLNCWAFFFTLQIFCLHIMVSDYTFLWVWGMCVFLTLSLGFCFLFSILVWILFCFVLFFCFFVLFCFAFWFCGFVFVFLDRVSLYSPGCPGTHFVEQAGLELRNQPASASQVLGLKVCTIMPIWFEFFIWLFFLERERKTETQRQRVREIYRQREGQIYKKRERKTEYWEGYR